jgi:hypothetical protein
MKPISQKARWIEDRSLLLKMFDKHKRDDDKWDGLLKELIPFLNKAKALKNTPFDGIDEIIAKTLVNTWRLRIPECKYTSNGKKSEEEVVVHITDAHCGKVNYWTNPDTMEAIKTYDVEIFKRTAQTLLDKIAEIVKLHRTTHTIKKLHLFMTGDLLENDRIFEGQQFLIDMCVGEQLWTATTTFVDMVNALLAFVEEIEIHIVPGNHGRTNLKRGSEPVQNSFEYHLARQIDLVFRNTKRVKVHIPNSWFHMAHIRGHKYMLDHGDRNYSWMSIPYYGIQRKAQATVIEMKFDYEVIGHFHFDLIVPISKEIRVIVGSCWPENEDHGLKNYGKLSKPVQWIFGLNDKRPMTWIYPLDISQPIAGLR